MRDVLPEFRSAVMDLRAGSSLCDLARLELAVAGRLAQRLGVAPRGSLEQPSTVSGRLHVEAPAGTAIQLGSSSGGGGDGLQSEGGDQADPAAAADVYRWLGLGGSLLSALAQAGAEDPELLAAVAGRPDGPVAAPLDEVRRGGCSTSYFAVALGLTLGREMGILVQSACGIETLSCSPWLVRCWSWRPRRSAVGSCRARALKGQPNRAPATALQHSSSNSQTPAAPHAPLPSQRCCARTTVCHVWSAWDTDPWVDCCSGSRSCRWHHGPVGTPQPRSLRRSRHRRVQYRQAAWVLGAWAVGGWLGPAVVVTQRRGR